MIDDRPTQANSMTIETWKERQDTMEYLNDRTWRYHGEITFLTSAGTIRSGTKSHILVRDDCNGQGGRME